MTTERGVQSTVQSANATSHSDAHLFGCFLRLVQQYSMREALLELARTRDCMVTGPFLCPGPHALSR